MVISFQIRSYLEDIFLISVVVGLSLNIVATYFEITLINFIITFFILFSVLLLFFVFFVGHIYSNVILISRIAQMFLIGTIATGIDLIVYTVTIWQYDIEKVILSDPHWLFTLNLFIMCLVFFALSKAKSSLISGFFSFIGIISGIFSVLWGSYTVMILSENVDGYLTILLGMQLLFFIYLIEFEIKRITSLDPFTDTIKIGNDDFRIAVVIPAHNEEVLITRTLSDIPKDIHRIYVVNDGSSDRTAQIVTEFSQQKDSRVELINHPQNKGVGAAIITGYQKAYQDGYDIFVVVGGDAQMDWWDLPNFIRPVVKGEADYVKGNRFIYGKKGEEGNAWREMPKLRIFGNTICSILTVIGSGYKGVFDSQMGYTAIHRDVIPMIDWSKARQGYGYPGDWLCRFHPIGVRVKDVPTRAIYLKDERQTQIKVQKFLFSTSFIMLKGYLYRLKEEYLSPKNWRYGYIMPIFCFLLMIAAFFGSVLLPTVNLFFLLVLAIHFGLFFVLSDIIKDKSSIIAPSILLSNSSKGENLVPAIS